MNMMISLDRLAFSSPDRMPSRFGTRTQDLRPELSGVREPVDGKPGVNESPDGKPDIREQADGKPGIKQPDLDTYECQTCKNRTYQDGSNDMGVSFKTPTKLSPEKAAWAVRSHESEHVARAWAEASREGKEVVSQSVTYHTDICPECGRTYIAGGNTRTVFRSAPETYEEEPIQKGVYVDELA